MTVFLWFAFIYPSVNPHFLVFQCLFWLYLREFRQSIIVRLKLPLPVAFPFVHLYFGSGCQTFTDLKCWTWSLTWHWFTLGIIPTGYQWFLPPGGWWLRVLGWIKLRFAVWQMRVYKTEPPTHALSLHYPISGCTLSPYTNSRSPHLE